MMNGTKAKVAIEGIIGSFRSKSPSELAIQEGLSPAFHGGGVRNCNAY